MKPVVRSGRASGAGGTRRPRIVSRGLKKRIVDDAYALAARTFPAFVGRPDMCLMLTGAVLAAAQRRGVRLVLQAGTCYWPRVTPEQDDGVSPNVFGYEWDPNDPKHLATRIAGRMPELHVWAGDPSTNELVDLTTGCFPDQCARLTELAWLAPVPPRWYWGAFDRLPTFTRYEVNEEATRLASNLLVELMRSRRAG